MVAINPAHLFLHGDRHQPGGAADAAAPEQPVPAHILRIRQAIQNLDFDSGELLEEVLDQVAADLNVCLLED